MFVNSNADAVVIPGEGSAIESSVALQLRELGLTSKIYILSELYTTQSFHDALGPYIEQIIFAGLYVDPTAPASRVFAADYKKKASIYPNHAAAEMYDIVKILAYAIGKGGYDAEGIRSALLSLDGVPSVFGGRLTMGPDHRTRFTKALALWQVRSGKLVRI